MNAGTIALVAIVALATALLCNAFAQQPVPNALEEPKPIPADNHIGRYQITGLNANNSFVLVDSHTGQCWVKSPSQKWQDQGNPAKN